MSRVSQDGYTTPTYQVCVYFIDEIWEIHAFLVTTRFLDINLEDCGSFINHLFRSIGIG